MLSTDTDILKTAEAWKREGRGVAIATVVETWGSVPRPVGSHLVIDDSTNFLGSVSGGCGLCCTDRMLNALDPPPVSV
jgi:xanthine/CO dehydrogenase XdhC/CoxF family maturation factor